MVYNSGSPRQNIILGIFFTIFYVNCVSATTEAQFDLAQKFRSPLLVNQSRSVALNSKNLNIVHRKAAQLCRVEVDQRQPLSETVGFLRPSKFNCNFEDGEVVYHHEGSPLSKTDSIKLHIYFFVSSGKTMYDAVTLNVKINLEAESRILDLKKDLTVKTWKGTSNPIDSDTLRFRYDPQNELCTVSFDGHRKLRAAERGAWVTTRRWPLLGRLVTFNKTTVDKFDLDCQQALLMGFRYMHKRLSSPNFDFIPIHVTIKDKQGNLKDQERHYIKVTILNSAPNHKPELRVLREVNLTNYGNTLSPMPQDCLTLTKDESKERFLSVFIDSISGPHGLAPQFVHLGDPTQPIQSFTMKDLQDGKVAFQILGFLMSVKKSFIVLLRVMDAHFGWSKQVELKINSYLPKARQFQYFTAPLQLYTFSSTYVRIHNIQTVGFVSLPFKYSVLAISEIDNRRGREGEMFVGDTSLADRPQYITNKTLLEFHVTYRHHGGLDDNDHFKMLGHYNSTNTPLQLNVHIVRVYERLKRSVLRESKNFTIQEEGHVCFTAKDMIRDEVLLFLKRDGVDLKFAISMKPKQGYLIQGPAYPNAEKITLFSLQDLLDKRVCYMNEKRTSHVDYFLIEQVGRYDKVGSNFTIFIKPKTDNYLQMKMDPNYNFTVSETAAFEALTPKFLNFYNFAHESSSNIVYKILEFPRYNNSKISEDAGRLISLKSLQETVYRGDTVLTSKIKDLKKAQINTVTTFTQRQIELRDIVFVPPLGDIGQNNRIVTFRYSVEDNFGASFVNRSATVIVLAEDNQTPKLDPVVVKVPRDGETFLDEKHLRPSDLDTDVKHLTLEVTLLPKYGTLFDENDRAMLTGHRFSALHLINKKIRYKNNGANVKEDLLNVTVSDGGRTSPSYQVDLRITKRVLDTGGWKLFVNNSVQVKENGSVVLHKSIFENINISSSKGVDPSYMVIYFPVKGVIIKNGIPFQVAGFSLQDVVQGRVSYQHRHQEIGPEPITDIVTLLAFPDKTFHLNFKILPVNSQRPSLQTGRPLQLQESGKVPVTSFTLSVVDRDTSMNEIRIDVVQQPRWGELNVGKNRIVTHFSIEDLVQGRVQYKNSRNSNGNEQTSDVFRCKAFDGKFFSSIVDVRIGIHPVNDEIPILILNDFSIPAGLSKVLTSDIFDVIDKDVPQDTLQIRVTGFPKYGFLYIQWRHGEQQVLHRLSPPITQQYLSMMQIVYQQNVTINSSSARDSFNISVYDGLESHFVFGTCNIRIIGDNVFRPKIATKSLIVDGLSTGAFVTVQELNATDRDTGDEDLTFVLLVGPTYGRLQFVQPSLSKDPKGSVNAVRIIRRGGNVTMNEIKRSKVFYQSTVALRSTLYKDSIAFRLTDGKFEEKVYLEVLFEPIKKKPMLIKLVTQPLSVELDGRVVVTTSNIMFKNLPDKSAMSGINIRLLTRLLCGSFVHVRNPSQSLHLFSYLDIKERRILFAASGCPSALTQISPKISAETSQGIVNAVLLIVLRPKPPQVPRLIRCDQLNAIEGADTYITTDVLWTSDTDTKPEDLIYIIGNQTELLLGEIMVDNLPANRFTQYDVNNRRVKFTSFPNILAGTPQRSEVVELSLTDGFYDFYVRNGIRSNEALQLTIMLKPMTNRDLIVKTVPPTVLESIGLFAGYRLTPANLYVAFPQAVYTVTRKQTGYFYNSTMNMILAKEQFTQEDINKNHLWFVLDKIKSVQIYETNFEFIVQIPRLKQDNYVTPNRMHIEWSVLGFEKKRRYKVCPRPGILTLGVQRKGSLYGKVVVEVGVESNELIKNTDFSLYSSKYITFLPGEYRKNVSVNILMERQTIEDAKRLFVFLKSPRGAILNKPNNVTISIQSRRTCDDADYFKENKVNTFIRKVEQGQPFPQALNNRTSSIQAEERYGGAAKSRKSDVSEKAVLNLPSSDILNSEYKKYLLEKKLAAEKERNKISCDRGWFLYHKRCYKHFSRSATWVRAAKLCKNNGGYLATLPDYRQTNFLKKKFNIGNTSFWIGLHILNWNTPWTWHNGQSLQSSNWDKTFPRMRGQQLRRRCVLVNKRGVWRNRPCNFRRKVATFMCMKNPLVGSKGT